MLISCCSSERLTFWVCASYPGSREVNIQGHEYLHRVAITVAFYLTVSLPCILWYGNLYLEQWSLLDDLHFHTWTVMNCYRLWSLIIGVFIHMIRFIAMRDWGSCLNSMIIDMKGRTLNMISFFIAMIEKRKCNELLIIAMKSQISSMKTDTFISSWKLLWTLPNDLHNIFYRSVRYSIYYNRKKTILPSLKYFTTLVRDELKIKYGANRHLKYAASPTEARALLWMRREMGWSQTIPERMPTVTNN